MEKLFQKKRNKNKHNFFCVFEELFFLIKKKNFFKKSNKKKKKQKKKKMEHHHHLNVLAGVVFCHVIFILFYSLISSATQCHLRQYAQNNLSGYLPFMYCAAASIPIFIAFRAASNLDDNPHYVHSKRVSFFLWLTQLIIFGIYCLCSKFVCQDSIFVMLLWILLGVVQCIYIFFSYSDFYCSIA